MGVLTGLDLAGSLSANQGEKDARGVTRRMRDQSIADQQATYGRVNALYSPYAQVGTDAMADLNAFRADPNAWLQKQPGYQFQLQQGLDGVNSQAATRGLMNSGANLKNVTQFGQNYAANAFGDEYNRLMGRVGFGYNATGAIGGADQRRADQSQAARLGSANALATSYQNTGANNAGFWGAAKGDAMTALKMMAGGF